MYSLRGSLPRWDYISLCHIFLRSSWVYTDLLSEINITMCLGFTSWIGGEKKGKEILHFSWESIIHEQVNFHSSGPMLPNTEQYVNHGEADWVLLEYMGKINWRHEYKWRCLNPDSSLLNQSLLWPTERNSTISQEYQHLQLDFQHLS